MKECWDKLDNVVQKCLQLTSHARLPTSYNQTAILDVEVMEETWSENHSLGGGCRHLSSV